MKIKTDEEHEEAIKIITGLMDDPNSSDVDMQALAKDIEAYEEVHYPIEPNLWQPIETAPKDRVVFFWVRYMTIEDEGVFRNTSGKPILGTGPDERVEGKYGCCWSALQTADHWMETPDPPSTDAEIS